MTGKLWGIGIGPGDPELMTLKAVRIINECDALAVPQTAGEKNVAMDIVSQVVDISQKFILFLQFPMVKDKIVLESAHEKNTRQIAEILNEGKNVAFITLGDVSIYSTYSYIQKKIEEKGFETEICAGVPSFCAVAARLKISLTSMKKPLHIIPAAHNNVDEGLRLSGTKIFMKAGGKIEDIKTAIAEDEGIFACGVTNCGMKDENVMKNFDEYVENSGYFTTIIVKEKE